MLAAAVPRRECRWPPWAGPASACADFFGHGHSFNCASVLRSQLIGSGSQCRIESVAAISSTRLTEMPCRCSIARGCSVGSSSIDGRAPPPRRRKWVLRFKVGGYEEMLLQSHPNFGGSFSTTGASHNSRMRAKLSLETETHTPQIKQTSWPMMGISRQPRTKMSLPSITQTSLSSLPRC